MSHPPIAAELIDTIYDEWRGFFASSEKFDYAATPPAQTRLSYLTERLNEIGMGAKETVM